MVVRPFATVERVPRAVKKETGAHLIEASGQYLIPAPSDMHVHLETDPLSDIAATRAISGVMLRGRWLGKEDLERGLEELAAGYAAER